MKKINIKIFNRGFTLIELLAVIVVLSVILVIAIPKIGNVMDETKKSLQQSAESLLRKAKEVSMMQNEEEIVYTIENGAFSGEVLKISGTLPDSGSIKINEDGTTEVAVHDDKYCALKSKIDDNVYVIDYDGYECRVTTPKSCFTYTKTSTQVTITGYDNTCDKDAIIPSIIDGLPVKTLGTSSFKDKLLTSVIVPNSLANIYSFAFYNNKLTNVTIPNSVTTIGASAFGMNQLTSLTIPNSVTSIEENAFYVNQIASITLPTNLSTITKNSFGYNQLTSLTIPNSVTSIEENAFYANQIASITLPTNLSKITKNSFGHNQLTSLTIPNSVTSIEENAFYANQIASIVIPNNVTNIKQSALEYNYLTSITIPSNVTIDTLSISQTFYDVYNPTKVGGTYTTPTHQSGTWTKQP